MDETKRPVPTHVVEQYRRQLMEMYRQQPPPPPPQEDTWLDERYPPPDIPPVIVTPIPSPPPPAPEEPLPEPPSQEQPTPPIIGESPFVGYLRIFVFTAGGAEPLTGARVTVTRQEGEAPMLYANAVTDIDGFTPILPLPTVDPALSMRPDGPRPFVPYDIDVTADGFRPARHENVPVYGNNYVTQPVSLVPLLPGEPTDDTRIFQSGGPADL